MKVRIESERCFGHGRCFDVAPRLCDDDGEGYGKVKGGGLVGPEEVDQAERAVRRCPERAVIFAT